MVLGVYWVGVGMDGDSWLGAGSLRLEARIYNLLKGRESVFLSSL